MLMNGIILIVTTKNILMDNTFSTLSIEFDTDLELIDIRFRTGLKYIFCHSTKAISKDKLYSWLNKLCLVFQQKLLMKGLGQMLENLLAKIYKNLLIVIIIIEKI